jgi:hypothetical protein
MTHRIVVNVQTGEIVQVEYTAEEQAAYDAATIANDAAEAAAAAEVVEEPVVVEPVTEEPTE